MASVSLWHRLAVTVTALMALTAFGVGLVEAKGKCDTCKNIVNKFNKGMEKTAKSNFGGGNTKWEEKQLGSFATSETRLVEILEGVCDGDKDCHLMLEEHEEDLEKWWFKIYAKNKDVELHTYFCIRRVKACCENGTWGPDCKECLGGMQRPCKDNGQCLGEGTREGTGQCKCHDGYKGYLCDECDEGYYEKDKNDTHTTCPKCDDSCDECFDAGPMGCEECKKGFAHIEGQGCQDIDECGEPGTCQDDEFCVNTVGSHTCTECHDACNGCEGGGAHRCKDCMDGYFKRGESSCHDCHPACLNSCTDETSQSCDDCRKGWSRSAVDGSCLDLDECETDPLACVKTNEHCVNTEGSYKCSTCHYACEACSGPGADKCKECKPGFQRMEEDARCLDIDECLAEGICAGANEKCLNTPGSYRCDCEKDFTRNKEGLCTPKPQDPPPEKKKSSSTSKNKKNTSKKDKSKDSNKSSSKKRKNTKQTSELLIQYWASLAIFGLVGVLLQPSVFAQTVTTTTFWVYLLWLSFKFDALLMKNT